jgi:hypothetical protein
LLIWALLAAIVHQVTLLAGRSSRDPDRVIPTERILE